MSWLEWFWVAVIVALILCPTKYDPAIRLKEWNMRKRDDREASKHKRR